ncbi:Aldehyde dehydrogenase family 3 member F1 [Hibiscus syriacus]|uniref:Aldehyde dehydrogenase n=1 Tax=Hibiscus syriacus TaxID=106335 RepID=A0A6A2WGE8_HIBSY|nr:aldehyde dehydrogenase family 3 member F1-like [Hibiscus syriacus]KAE8657823.1 Aldehyde dehydrogenase family 3 member F1 [Hibiscus syriacus]
MEKDLGKQIMEARESYRNGNTKPISWRRSQLQALKSFLLHYEVQIFRALNLDLGKHYVEAFRDEVGLLKKSVNLALENLNRWNASTKAKLPIIALLSYAELVPEPLGLILVISSWNFPLGLSLEPLIGAIAAGNAVVLKPSEMAPACSSLLANTLPKYLDNQAIKVIEGGPTVGQQLLQQKWDKIFFTGSPKVGRMIMSEAAKNLTPVTLELGGKCPAVLDSLSWSWDKEVAIKRIIGAKYGSCAGQACISIDYVLVEKSFSSTAVELMKAIIRTMYGDNPRESHSVARIVNKHHFLRLKNILTDQKVKDCIVYGGSMDEDSLYMEPTILVDPPLESAIMTEEIFGPLLPIITLDKIEDGIDFINSRPKPLAIYVFTKNEVLRKRIVSETSSGSVVFNDAIIQFAADTIPFGGIGESGMGKYHGKFSFDTFTHYKAVVRRSFLTDFWYRFPPWNNHKMELLEDSYGYDYFGLLLVILGLKRSRKAFHVN